MGYESKLAGFVLYGSLTWIPAFAGMTTWLKLALMPNHPRQQGETHHGPKEIRIRF
jgi:hypothetical protein